MGDADKVIILNGTNPGSTPQEPLALVANRTTRLGVRREGSGECCRA